MTPKTPLVYIAPTLIEAVRLVNAEPWRFLRSLRVDHRRVTPMADALLTVHGRRRRR